MTSRKMVQDKIAMCQPSTRLEARDQTKKMLIDRPRKSVMTTKERISYSLMEKTTMYPTRFLDEGTLRKMGILDEVMTLLDCAGLKNFCRLRAPTYPVLARQFFATVEVVYLSKRDPYPKYGKVTFKVKNKLYEISIEDLFGVYGLHFGTYAKYKPFNNVQDFWNLIASGNFSRHPKMSMVRYPPLRIYAKFLANTMFARKECGTMKSSEFALLYKVVGLQMEYHNGDMLNAQIGNDVNIGCILAKSMTIIRKIKTKQQVCYMGGLVTPLLEYFGIDLSREKMLGEMDSINRQYLMRCDTLSKDPESDYRFQFWDNNSLLYEIELLNKRYTVFNNSNFRFEYFETRFLANDAAATIPSVGNINRDTWELPHLRMKKNTPQKKFLVTTYQIQDRVNWLAKKQTAFLLKQFKKIKDRLTRVAGDQYGQSSKEEIPEWNDDEEERYKEGQYYYDDDDDEIEEEEDEEDFGGASTS